MFCACGRNRVLTVEQEREHLPCDLCQGEHHAKTFKDRFEALGKEKNGLDKDTGDGRSSIWSTDGNS